MQKNKIIVLFAVIAIVLSGITGYLVYSYLEPSRGTIYVFNDSYSAGQQVTANMLSPIQVDSSIVVSGRKSNIENQFVTTSEYASIIKSGDSLRMDVGEGMPLTTSMLSVAGGSSIEMNMQPSSIAVTIGVNSISGVTNDLKEGSRVNIYSVINGSVILLQQNKRILSVYKDGSDLSAVSVEEDVDSSMELIYAQTYGSIYLGLVDATGYQSSDGTPQYPSMDATDSSDTSLNDFYNEDGSLSSSLFEQNDMSEAETEVETEVETETK